MTHIGPKLDASLRALRRTWLVTGAAGFIGSNLVETLLASGQHVIGIDNFATGYQRNLDEALAAVDDDAKMRFRFIRADISDRATCDEVFSGVDVVLHQAALGSVPRSIAEPLATHNTNVNGFLNMLDAARRANVRRFIYAASSSTYGDEPNLPKLEDRIGAPLSPYAVTKLVNEIYAAVYARSYGFKSTGLRYFNVFGPRQDPEGGYAAVIPRWTVAMMRNQQVTINGDGETSRDFCYVANAVQGNIRAALAPDETQGNIYNIAVGKRTSLNSLFEMLRDALALHQVRYDRLPHYGDFSPGDVRHSEADIGKAQRLIGFAPTHCVRSGLTAAVPWYLGRFGGEGR